MLLQSDKQPFRVLVGLGNPGLTYKLTRHNIGFMVVHAFARKHHFTFKHSSKLLADVAQGSLGDQKVILLLPTTYMNHLGQSVSRCLEYYQLTFLDLLVVVDDIFLPFGKMRLRLKGSTGGHNGLKSLQFHLKTADYSRLKIGIGSPEEQPLDSYVLGRFPEEEQKELPMVIEEALAIVEAWILHGVEEAMNVLSKKKHKPSQ